MTQVISDIDFEQSKIMDGEWPTPSVLNRPLLACMDADNRLEESVRYIARSMNMEVTEYTKFLTHCEGEGTDIIGGIVPSISTKSSDAFVYDGVFKGSAFTQHVAENILSSTAGLDTTLSTFNGWSNTNPGSSGTTIRSGRDGTTISNTNYKSVSVGSVELRSAPVSVAADAVLTNSVEVRTKANLRYIGINVSIGLVYLGSEGNTIKSDVRDYNSNALSGILVLESSVAPANVSKVYTSIVLTYGTPVSIASITFSNAMLSISPVYQPHCLTARSATNIRYPSAASATNNVGTVFCWTKFNTLWLKKHIGPIGPLFLSSGSNNFSIGAIHDSADGASLRLKLRMYTAGSSIPQDGNDIVLDSVNADEYLPCLMRFSEYIDTDVKRMRIEFAIVDLGLTVHKSTIDLPTFTIPSPLDICVGSDDVYTDYFNCPVSEIRYDETWINDYELITIALSKRAFLIQSDVQGIGMTDVMDYVNSAKPNLIYNPDGRLSLNHWCTFNNNSYTGLTLANPQGLTTTVSDANFGSGFVWSGSAANDISFNSAPISVVSGTKLIFRSEMYTDGISGSAGIAIGFYGASGIVGPLTLGQALGVNQGAEPQYYDVSAIVPSGMSYAVAIMYVSKGTSSPRVVWSKLKMEFGADATIWLDDTTPKYAVYAP